MSTELRILAPTVMLCALLASAVWHDVGTRRIPNRLVLCGALAGLAWHAMLPAGAGLFSSPFGSLGLCNAVAGLGLGLAMLMPMYLLGAMGAGDVKLMGMIGAFLGLHETLGAVLLTLMAGGLLGLTVAVSNGQLRQVLDNIRHLLQHALLRAGTDGSARLDAPAQVTGKLPYAIAIAAGTILQLLLANNTDWETLL